jgi:hypothetical protein
MNRELDKIIRPRSIDRCLSVQGMVVGEGVAPSGTLIWRLPGFIRPRRTAGATHRFARLYQGIDLHTSSALARLSPFKRNPAPAVALGPPRSPGKPAPAVEGIWESAHRRAKAGTRKTPNRAPIPRAAHAGNPHTDQRWPFLLRHREQTRSFPQHNLDYPLSAASRQIPARRSPRTPLPAQAACRLLSRTTHTKSEAGRCSGAELQ